MCNMGHIGVLIDELLRFDHKILLFRYMCILLMPPISSINV